MQRTNPSSEDVKFLLDSLQHLRIDPHHVVQRARIGTGGHGDVFLGELRIPGQPAETVAIKKVRPTGFLDKPDAMHFPFLRELKLWAELDHPNILRLRGFCLEAESNIYWLISPYLKNGDIFMYIEREGLEVSKRMKLIMSIAECLRYLHRDRGICHGDLKGSNILVDDDGNAKLCDFGVAKNAQNSSNLTTTTHPSFTIPYQAPEMFQVQVPRPSMTSDIWALGCVIVETAAGVRPYEGLLPPQIATSMAQGLLPAKVAVLSIHADLKQVVASCWSFDPQHRIDILTCLSELQVVSLRIQLETHTVLGGEEPKFIVMTNLGAALRDRFMRGGSREDLLQASDLLENALALCPDDHDIRKSIVDYIGSISAMMKQAKQEHLKFDSTEDNTVSELGRMQWNLWNHSRDVTHLASCISYYRSALHQRPLGHPGRRSTLHNLGLAVLMMATTSKNLAGVDESIALFRECLKLESGLQGVSDSRPTVQKLGDASYFRFELSKNAEDLEEFGRCYYKSLESQPKDGHDRDHDLHNLSNYHFQRFHRTHQHSEWEKALSFAMQAYQSPDQGARLIYGLEIATCYMGRFVVLGERDGLYEAIKYLFEILNSNSSSDELHAHESAFSQLDNALCALLMGNESDLTTLDEIIGYCRQALATPRGGDTASHPILPLISRVLSLRYDLTDDRSLLDEALQYREQYLRWQTGTGPVSRPASSTMPSGEARKTRRHTYIHTSSINVTFPPPGPKTGTTPRASTPSTAWTSQSTGKRLPRIEEVSERTSDRPFVQSLYSTGKVETPKGSNKMPAKPTAPVNVRHSVGMGRAEEPKPGSVSPANQEVADRATPSAPLPLQASSNTINLRVLICIPGLLWLLGSRFLALLSILGVFLVL